MVHASPRWDDLSRVHLPRASIRISDQSNYPPTTTYPSQLCDTVTYYIYVFVYAVVVIFLLRVGWIIFNE